jgi:hypothetical protein
MKIHFFLKYIPLKVARFSLVQHTKTGKMYQMTTKNDKYNASNGCKIVPMAINLETFFIPRPSKAYPNWDFGMKI